MLFLNRLARAAAGGDDEEVERLLAAGQSPNDAGILGSPIHEASRRGRVACVKLLCNARADIKQRDAVTSETPLHCAVVFGHVQAAQILVDAGSDLNAKDLAGVTPLQQATTSLFIPSVEARHSLIELLMKAGADPKIRDKVGLSPCENAHVLKVQKEMLHQEWDRERFQSMEAFLFGTVPPHAAGPYAAARGAGHGKFVRDPWSEVPSAHAANVCEETIDAPSDVLGEGNARLDCRASGPGQANGMVGGDEGTSGDSSRGACQGTGEGALSEEGGDDAAEGERKDGLALWLHQANRMFAKKPIREHEVGESSRERHKELAMLRAASPAPLCAAPTCGRAAPESPANGAAKGSGNGQPVAQTKANPHHSSSTAASSPASSHSSPLVAAPMQGASPTTLSLNPPVKAPLVTFIGSTHTIAVTKREQAGGGSSSSNEGSANDQRTAVEHGHERSRDSACPASASTKSPATHSSHAAVQSLLTLAEGLFASPQPHSPEVLAHGTAQAEAVDVWEHRVIPEWEKARHDPEVLALWRKGLPPRVRRRVWQLAIGNELNITADDFRQCLALSKYVAASNVEASGPDTRRRRPSARARRQAQREAQRQREPTDKEEGGRVRGPGPDADVRAAGAVPLVGADLEREFRGASALAGSALRSSRSLGQAPKQPTLWGAAGPTTPGSGGAGEAVAGGRGGALLCRELPRISVAEADVGNSMGVTDGRGPGQDTNVAYYDRPRAVSEAAELAGGCEAEEGSCEVEGGAAGRGAAGQLSSHKCHGALAGQVEMKELVTETEEQAHPGAAFPSNAKPPLHPSSVHSASASPSAVATTAAKGEVDGLFGRAQGDALREDAWIDKATIRQIELDLDRTYTELGLFGGQGPYQQPLRDVLLAYSCFRPSVGYVQGMGYIASTLLLYMEPEAVFVCMANLLHKHHFPDFLLVDMEQIDLYAAAFTQVFAKELPALQKHLTTTGVDCRLYIVEWWMTVFCTVLPLSASSLVWDLLVMEGISAIVRITIGILAVLQPDLLGASLEKCLTVLTHAEDWFDVSPQDGGTIVHEEEAGDEGAAGEEGAEGGWKRARESKSFAAVMEAADAVDMTSDAFLLLLHHTAISPKHAAGERDHLQEIRHVMRQIAMLAKQDEEAARERRARIHRGFLERFNLVWHATAGLGWAHDTEDGREEKGAGDAAEEKRQPCDASLGDDGLHAASSLASHDVPAEACAAGGTDQLAHPAVYAGYEGGRGGGQRKGGEVMKGKHGDALLAAAANVADKWKEDVRSFQLKAEELLMPLTARGGVPSVAVSTIDKKSPFGADTSVPAVSCDAEQGHHARDTSRREPAVADTVSKPRDHEHAHARSSALSLPSESTPSRPSFLPAVRGNVATHWVETVPLNLEDAVATTGANGQDAAVSGGQVGGLAGASPAIGGGASDSAHVPKEPLVLQEPSPGSVSDSWSEASENPSVWT